MSRRLGIWAVGFVGLLALVMVFFLNRSQRPPDSVDFLPDIPYAVVDGQEMKLDLARPKQGEGPWPLVVFIHGGGWQAGDKSNYRQAIFNLAQEGYAAASLQYRFAPRYTYPAQFDDVKAALAFLREHAKEWNLNPDRVGAMGGSAGGHLVLMLATDPEAKLRAGVSLAGPTDLRADFPEATVNIIRKLVGKPREEAEAELADASPITRIGPGMAPILMIHGDHDEVVPYEQSVAMRDACEKAGTAAELFTIRDGDHGGGGRPEDLAEAIARAVKFLDDHVKTTRPIEPATAPADPDPARPPE